MREMRGSNSSIPGINAPAPAWVAEVLGVCQLDEGMEFSLGGQAFVVRAWCAESGLTVEREVVEHAGITIIARKD